MKFRAQLIVAISFVAVTVGCGDDAAENSANSANATTASADGGATNNASNSGTPDAGATNNGGTPDAGETVADAGEPGEIPTVLAEGTARETPVFVPADYDASESYPLVMLLHGYTASGAIQDAYFGISSLQDEYGFIFIRPDGTRDAAGNRFWNATEYCCDLAGSGVDDEAYLMGLIEEAKSKLSVDPKRIYLMGHSNGGFMSYRLSCNHGETFAAMVSLAGANFTDPALCDSETPVAVAQAHGTLDTTIAYSGTALYPSALESVQPWAARNGCADELALTGTELDLDSASLGDETEIEEFAGCASGFAVERWTMSGSGHVPGVGEAFRTTAVDFLYRHSRP